MTALSELLPDLYFGKDDAESDIAPGGLLRNSFLETAAYLQARAGKKRLVIGRKGSGKSAICMHLLTHPAGDGGQTCLVAPDEISAEEVRQFALQGVASEQAKAVFWRYVIAIQVAKHVVSHARTHKPKDLPEVKAIRKFLVANGEGEDLHFSERFYQIVGPTQVLTVS
jgi:ABC-type hemin transport system ATPase subunit